MMMINQKNKPESQLLYELIYISLDYPIEQRKDLIKKWLIEGYDPNINWDNIEKEDLVCQEYNKQYLLKSKERNIYSQLKDEDGFYNLNCIVCNDAVKRKFYILNAKCNKSKCRLLKIEKKEKIKSDSNFECNCSNCNISLIRRRKHKKYLCDDCKKKNKNDKELNRYYYLNNKSRIENLEFYNEETKFFECPCTSCKTIVNRIVFTKDAKCTICKKKENIEYAKKYVMTEEQIANKKEYQKKYQEEYRKNNPRKKA